MNFYFEAGIAVSVPLTTPHTFLTLNWYSVFFVHERFPFFCIWWRCWWLSNGKNNFRFWRAILAEFCDFHQQCVQHPRNAAKAPVFCPVFYEQLSVVIAGSKIYSPITVASFAPALTLVSPAIAGGAAGVAEPAEKFNNYGLIAMILALPWLYDFQILILFQIFNGCF